MSVSAPLMRKTIENAIATWFVGATGIGVIWSNQKAPALGFPYGTLHVMSIVGLGQPETRQSNVTSPDPGEELELEIAQQKRLVLSVNVYALANDADLDARAYMDKAEHALALPSFQLALSNAGVVVLDVGLVQSFDFVEAEAWLSRAQLDVTFGVTARASEFATFIETVEAEFQLDPPPPPDPIDITFNLNPAPTLGNANANQIVVDCQASDNVGDLVYVLSALEVARVDVTDDTKMPACGVLISKTTATRGVVQLSGIIEGVFSGLTPGAAYCVGGAGTPSLTQPSGPGRRHIQPIGTAFSPTIFALNLAATTTVRV